MKFLEVALHMYLPLGLALVIWFKIDGADSKKKSSKRSTECGICKDLVDTFNKGVDATSKTKHYGGGDTAWEEAKLSSYENSELRLVEITDDSLCHMDDSSLQKQCHHFAEKHEELVEDWWFKHKVKHPLLFDWLCIDQVKVCCPNDTFGPDCLPCKFIDNSGIVCSAHGKCNGSGTRTGTGACKCDKGYTGERCDSCKLGYYPSTAPPPPDNADTDSSTHPLLANLTCLACDASCAPASGCTSGGATGCVSCAAGYEDEDEEYGCEDIDECGDEDASSGGPCAPHQYCTNTPGSYSCPECAAECLTCRGDGADSCNECAAAHIIVDGKCTALSSTTQDDTGAEDVALDKDLADLGGDMAPEEPAESIHNMEL